MPRNMSFMLTTEQMQNRIKTVTRRTGWSFLKPGDIVNAVEKGMGLKKGEKIKRIRQIRITRVSKERLGAITQDECVLEGFPEMTPVDFVVMFCRTHACTPKTMVRRIEFEHMPEEVAV